MTLAAALTSLGLVLDAIGGVLLAVEAIGLDNLVALRSRVLPAARLYFESPLLVDGRASIGELDLNRRRGFGGRRGWFVAFHVFSALGLLLLLDGTRVGLEVGPPNLLLELLWSWDSAWRWAAMLGLLGGLAVTMPFTVGCWVHQAVAWFLDRFIWLLLVIERGTPNGTTGIVGGLLFALGFMLQLAGVWV